MLKKKTCKGQRRNRREKTEKEWPVICEETQKMTPDKRGEEHVPVGCRRRWVRK